MSFVKFHSKAGGAFFFLPETQKQVFKLLGRPCTESGAIAPEEAAEWIRILDAAVERDKRERKAQEEDRRARREKNRLGFREKALHEAKLWDEEERLEEEERDAGAKVPLSARLYPLLRMLREAVKEGAMVMWGVP